MMLKLAVVCLCVGVVMTATLEEVVKDGTLTVPVRCDDYFVRNLSKICSDSGTVMDFPVDFYRNLIDECCRPGGCDTIATATFKYCMRVGPKPK